MSGEQKNTNECCICLDTYEFPKVVLQCKHTLCKKCCISKEHELKLKTCPICREQIKGIGYCTKLHQILVKTNIPVCVKCNCKLPLAASKCWTCGGPKKYIEREEVLTAEIVGHISLCMIYIVGKRPECRCCYEDFSGVFYKQKDVLYHVLPNSYIRADSECPFLKDHCLLKCEEMSLKILE
jgi:hypothetical protein